jgi:hypothetical protein
MMQLLTKVYGLLASMDRNNELLMTSDKVIFGLGHFNKIPHFMLTNSLLSEHLLVLVSSFLDEYNFQFTANNSVELKDRIIKFRQQLKPVLSRINQWRDIKRYRNIILAHNFRLKDDSSIFDENVKKIDFKLPLIWDELVLLVELCSLITKNMGREFPELLVDFYFSESINDKINIIKNDIDFQKDYDNVCEQIKTLGLTYTQRTEL